MGTGGATGALGVITFISVEDVLSRGEDLKTAQPTKWAKALYDGMRLQHNTVALTQAEYDIARWWLRREHFDDWSRILTWNEVTTWGNWKVDQVRETLAEGWEVFAYVDADVSVVGEVVQMGVAGICVSYPTMATGWKEVAPPRAWASVAATVDGESR
jgi:hypothetical protein